MNSNKTCFVCVCSEVSHAALSKAWKTSRTQKKKVQLPGGGYYERWYFLPTGKVSVEKEKKSCHFWTTKHARFKVATTSWILGRDIFDGIEIDKWTFKIWTWKRGRYRWCELATGWPPAVGKRVSSKCSSACLAQRDSTWAMKRPPLLCSPRHNRL